MQKRRPPRRTAAPPGVRRRSIAYTSRLLAWSLANRACRAARRSARATRRPSAPASPGQPLNHTSSRRRLSRRFRRFRTRRRPPRRHPLRLHPPRRHPPPRRPHHGRQRSGCGSLWSLSCFAHPPSLADHVLGQQHLRGISVPCRPSTTCLRTRRRRRTRAATTASGGLCCIHRCARCHHLTPAVRGPVPWWRMSCSTAVAWWLMRPREQPPIPAPQLAPARPRVYKKLRGSLHLIAPVACSVAMRHMRQERYVQDAWQGVGSSDGRILYR